MTKGEPTLVDLQIGHQAVDFVSQDFVLEDQVLLLLVRNDQVSFFRVSEDLLRRPRLLLAQDALYLKRPVGSFVHFVLDSERGAHFFGFGEAGLLLGPPFLLQTLLGQGQLRIGSVDQVGLVQPVQCLFYKMLKFLFFPF